MYAKAVVAGRSDAALSDEEAEALRLALAATPARAGRRRRDGPGVGLTGKVSRAARRCGHGPRMPRHLGRPDEPLAHAAGNPSPLEQIPVWDGFVPDAPADAIDGDPPAGLDALLGGLNPEQLAGGDPWRGAAPRRRRRRDRQDPGHHPADRVADRDAPGEAVGDPRADVHGEGRGGDAGPGRPARAVRLHGHARSARSTRSATGIIREYALELGLPTDVRVLTRPEVVIFLREHLFEFELDEYRPLGDPTRFLGALATLFSRCKDEDVSPDGVPRPRRRGCADRGSRRRTPRRRGARRGGRPAAARAGPRLRPLPGAARETPGSSTSATR